MPVSKFCRLCGNRSRSNVCDDCGTRDEREPWRAVYRDPRYQAMRRVVLRRAEGRCEHVEPRTGRRCKRTTGLEVNHRDKLRLSFDDPAVDPFDPDRGEAACRSHHRLDDYASVA